MSNSKRSKTEMAPSFQKNRKVQDTKSEPLKPGEKAQPTAEQIRIAQIIDTKPDDPDLKDKIKQVMDATKRPEDEVLTALHDCDNDPNQAVTMILEGSQKVWSTLTKKKKNKPPADKLRDNQQPNAGTKNTTGVSTNEGGQDWNESDNADENSAPNRSMKGKGPGGRPPRSSSRPWVKRGVTRSNGKENFNRGSENSDWSKVGFKPSRGRGNFKNSRNSTYKDCDNSDRDISERLGQGDVPTEKQDSGSDWGSDTSDHHKNISGTENTDDKQVDNFIKHSMNDNKWQPDDQYWPKNSGRGVGRGGSRGRGGFNSYGGKQPGDGDSKPPYQNKGSSNVNSSRGRGRYNRPDARGRGDGRPRPQRDSRPNHESWDNDTGDRGGFRGRMTNGPSNRGWRGSRGRGRGNSRPSIDTWNPHSSKENEAGEDWDQEEVYTGSLADTKVFTPSPCVDVSKVPQDGSKEPHEGDVSAQLIAPNEVPGSIPSSSQFLSQLTQASSGKPLPQSIFNDVHFSKADIPSNDFGGGFSINTFTESEPSSNITMDDMSRVKSTRPRVPPPSKIPSSAVEMPPDIGSGIPLVDVQFGALELGDVMDSVQQSSTQASPSPVAENLQSQPSMMTAVSDPLLMNETQTYSAVRSSVPSNPISQLPELLSSKSEPPTSSFYQESIYQSNQFPKSTHQSYNANYTTQQVGSTYNTQSIYGSAGLGTTSLTNPYQTYSGNNIQRHSALTSTTNSKEFDVPTPSVNISPINPSSGTTVTPSSILSSAQGGNVSSKSTSSTMGKMMTVPPGVAASPIVNPPQYIMNQTPGVPYFQQHLYSLEDFQLLQQQRIPPGHVPTAGYYDVTFQNTPNREGVQFNLSDTRYAQGDSNTSPVQASSLNAQTGSQNHQQPMMNPALPPAYAYAFYSSSMIPGSYQYTAPAIFPIPQSGTGSGHGNTNSPYAKTPANYSGNYAGNYEGSQPTSEYKSGNNQGVSKVQQYQVTNASTSTGLSNIYTKSYEKHNFCQTPPPYTLGSQSSGLGPSYGGQAQQLFYSPITHHTMHQPLHQDSGNAANSRSQLASQPNKVNNKPKYQTPYWHQN